MSINTSTNPFDNTPNVHNITTEQNAQSSSCCTAKKMVKVAAFIFVVCALVVATAALCMHYPSANAVAYSCFGTVGGLAFITMCVAGVRTLFPR